MATSMKPEVVTLRYFAWVREKTGMAEERVQLPDHLATVADVIAWQRARGENFAAAFDSPANVRVALDHAHASPKANLAGVREIAFFPPVTGG
jgi:molybdopterin synthase sulfur carrier subunit